MIPVFLLLIAGLKLLVGHVVPNSLMQAMACYVCLSCMRYCNLKGQKHC